MILSATPYDPDEPEGSSRASEYITPKDLRRLGLALIPIALLLIPVYLTLRENANRHVCSGNFKAMYDAMAIYASLYDDRFPPAFAESAPGKPLLDDRGRPFTWASLVFDSMSRRYGFRCPSAKSEENAVAQHPTVSAETLVTSYGLYVALSARPKSFIDRPSQTALIAETANKGARGTLNPHPLDGPDGFLIGYDTGNDEPTPQTKYVTRLAFYDSAGGKFALGGGGRHGGRIHVLYADGQLGLITPPAARVEHLPPNLAGLWSTR